MCFGVKNEGILYVGEGVTYFERLFGSPSESGNPPGYGLSMSHSTERGHRADREKCDIFRKVSKFQKSENLC